MDPPRLFFCEDDPQALTGLFRQGKWCRSDVPLDVGLFSEWLAVAKLVQWIGYTSTTTTAVEKKFRLREAPLADDVSGVVVRIHKQFHDWRREDER